MTKPGPWLNWNGVIRLLKREAKAAGGISQWAKERGVNYEYARMVAVGKRVPGPAIVKALGLEKALLWRRPSR